MGLNRDRLTAIANGASPADADPEAVERADFERVRRTLYMAVVCEAIPRRLGPTAVGTSLALDKRVARKVANTYRTLWRALGDDAPEWSSRAERLALAKGAELDARKAGAVVRWPQWLRARIEELEERRAAVAALGLSSGRVRWAVRRVRFIENELENVKRIAAEAVVAERRQRGHRS